MIRRLCALLLTLPATIAAQTPVARTYSVSPTVSMRIWVPGGTVRVETWDRDSLQVTGSIARGTHFFGYGSGAGAKIGVESDDPRDTGVPSGDLTVTVPRRAHVWIKMTEGNVMAGNTAGELEITSVAGKVSVRNASGVVSVDAIDAAVDLAAISGDVRVHTGGGSVVLQQIHGMVTVATVAGNVDLAGIGVEDARVETISGGITFSGTVAAKALVDFETHSGPIVINVDAQAPPSLSLSSRSGKVRNPAVGPRRGAGEITARSFKGDINVRPVAGIEGRKAGPPT